MSYFANSKIIISETTAETFFANVSLLGQTAYVAALGLLQGTNGGYTASGTSPSPIVTNVIDRFPFANDANATDVGDLTVARGLTTGHQSEAFGYITGGPSVNTIDKFPFAAKANASDVGDLRAGLWTADSAGNSSKEFGYVSGGFAPGLINNIQKFPFASDANATNVGILSAATYRAAGQSSFSKGYVSGGTTLPSLSPPQTATNTIESFPFSTDANSSDVSDLSVARQKSAGHSSYTHGYTSGGGSAGPTFPNATLLNTIDKFPFASNANATDVGDLTIIRMRAAGQSSTVSGYASGGYNSVSRINVIDKFPFSTDANATDDGDLTLVRADSSGASH